MNQQKHHLKIKLSVLLLLFVYTASQKIIAQNFTQNNIDTLSNYIYNQQYADNTLPSYGAIRKNTGTVAIAGQNYCFIEPYFNHIATIGILQSNHPDKCGFALRWMNWYLNHLDTQGKMVNFCYKVDGTAESTCPAGATGIFCNYIDAEDSDPALFWILAYDYYTTSGDQAFFTSSVKTKLETAATYLLDSLIDTDNLSVAKKSYPIKFTMDNSEVYKGLLALSKIEGQIYNDASKSSLYLAKANSVKTAVKTLLYNNTTGLYDYNLGSSIDSTQWYGFGITASVWPQLFGVDSLNDTRSIHQRIVLHNNFDGTPGTNWTTSAFLGSVDAYTWASIGYLFSIAGDTAKGYAQASYISSVFVSPFPSTPCYVGDAGWVTMNMATKYPAPGCGIVTQLNGKSSGQLISIYPNPANDKLVLTFNEIQISHVKVFDELGREILNLKLSNTHQPLTIDISNFGAGLYYVIAITDHGTSIDHQKFIVTK